MKVLSLAVFFIYLCPAKKKRKKRAVVPCSSQDHTRGGLVDPLISGPVSGDGDGHDIPSLPYTYMAWLGGGGTWTTTWL